MKNIYKIFLVLISLSIVSSCSNFEKLNTDPNAATSVSPDMLATQLLKDSYRFWNPNPTDFSTGNLWCKHLARLDATSNPYQYYYSYWPYGGFGGLQKTTNFKRMIEFAEGNPNKSSFEGLALFLKATAGFSATMDMGDIPYSEAGMAEDGILRPKYDKQADVFVEVLADLKAAELKFAEGKNFGSCDIMFNGDATKWRRLCNAMQLKIIQTISKKATAEQKARFAEIVAANNLMTGNADNFQLAYSENPNATHPFYNGENQRILDGVSKLTVDALINLNDRRLFYFAEPAKAQINAGKLETDFTAYVGAPTELASSTLAINNQTGMYSLVNIRYTLYRTGDPMIKFTYAEQCFIIAEAIEEGWVTGNAQTYYENGVKAMLAYYMNLPSASAAKDVHNMKIDQTYIDGYFTGAAAYATAGTKDDRLHQILTQRWLIDFMQGNGLNYQNFLRTGWPQFPLDPATSMNPDDKNVYPKRWKYDTGELVTNPENYQKAVDEQYGGYDGINEVPWWLKP
jgi:hypothetical protein